MHSGEQILENKSHGRNVLDAIFDFLGGVAGGTASVYVGQPLDTVKVKMQTFPHLYSNAFKCFKTTLMQDGISRGLYAGTVPSLAAQIAENSVLFLGYGVCQKLVAKVTGKSKISELSIIENAVSGSFAAILSSFVLCPTELVKCRLQAMKETQDKSISKTSYHIGPLELTRNILKSEGVRGLFHGLVPTFVREVPGYFFFFGGYEISRQFFTPPGKSKDDIGAVKTIICGGIGGVSLWVAIFPSDVIKSRVQVGAISSKLSFIQMVLKIARTEGIRALYKGLGPTILRTFPATGALFLAYENVKKLFGNLADSAGVH